jgi:hypothetical protein
MDVNILLSSSPFSLAMLGKLFYIPKPRFYHPTDIDRASRFETLVFKSTLSNVVLTISSTLLFYLTRNYGWLSIAMFYLALVITPSFHSPHNIDMGSHFFLVLILFITNFIQAMHWDIQFSQITALAYIVHVVLAFANFLFIGCWTSRIEEDEESNVNQFNLDDERVRNLCVFIFVILVAFKFNTKSE